MNVEFGRMLGATDPVVKWNGYYYGNGFNNDNINSA